MLLFRWGLRPQTTQIHFWLVFFTTYRPKRIIYQLWCVYTDQQDNTFYILKIKFVDGTYPGHKPGRAGTTCKFSGTTRDGTLWTSVRKTRPKSAENSEVTTLKYFFSTFFYVLPIARPVSFHTVKIIHSKVNLMSLNTFRCFTEHQNYFSAL